MDVLTQIIEEANERIAELAEVCNRLDLRFIEDQAVWNNYHQAFAVIENYRLMLCANWRRSWTLTFAVHGKRMWWMLISYSTPFVPGAKSRYLWSSGCSLHVLDRTHSTGQNLGGVPINANVSPPR